QTDLASEKTSESRPAPDSLSVQPRDEVVDGEEAEPLNGHPELAVDPGAAMMAWAQKEGMGLPDLRRWLEIEFIKRALYWAEGNITKAAEHLDMKRPRLSQIVNATPELAELKRELTA
ncbi:MAG: hypothetical protein KC561_07410, partial [Myxococcales bacterium]|nr:hypothetical protein [Myxococcales bacterium]